MLFLNVLAVLLGAVSCIVAFDGSIQRHRPAKFRAPSAHVEAPHVLSLTRQEGSRSAKLLRSLRIEKRDVTPSVGYAPAIPAVDGAEFLTVIEWAGQPFQVILDTGSSDTWLVRDDFEVGAERRTRFIADILKVLHSGYDYASQSRLL